MLEIAFVLPPSRAPRRAALAEALRHELTALGVRSRAVEGCFPPARAGLVYAVLPGGEADLLAAPPELLARSLVVDVDGSAPQAPVAALFEIGSAGVDARRDRDEAAERLMLGHTDAWAAPDPEADRDLDVLVTGDRGWRSDRLVASFAGGLARVRSHIALTGEEPDLALLRRARVVLDVRDEPPARFDQLRAVRAILSGAVLVAETAPGIDPLVPGDDLLCGRAETLGHLTLEAVEDAGLRGRLRTSASAKLAARPLRAAAERLAAVAADVDAAAPVPWRAAWRPPAPDEPDSAPPAPSVDPEAALLRRALKQLRIEGIETRRRLERLDARLAGDSSAGVDVLAQTPAYAPAQPRVSVLVTLYEFERQVEAALQSVAASTERSVELLIVDDASNDGSADRVQAWMRERPDVPALLVRHCWNRGLPHARNTAIDFARGELAFVLDADNALYPDGLARLVAALDADPGADFAYGVIECYSAEGPAGLLSVGPWEPDRLRSHNWIDAMALIRTEPLRRGGGFATDPRLHGIEDYDLWCRMAEEGRRGVAVPEIVGRYRVSEHGMLRSTSGISSMDAMSVLIERHPTLMAGVAPRG